MRYITFFTELQGASLTSYSGSSPVCALRRSTVNISITYDLPSEGPPCNSTVLGELWFKWDRNKPVYVGNDEGWVDYSCQDETYTRASAKRYGTRDLRNKDVRPIDSAEYTFRKSTKLPDLGFTVYHTLTVTVKGKLDNNIVLMWPEWELMNINIPLFWPCNVC